MHLLLLIAAVALSGCASDTVPYADTTDAGTEAHTEDVPTNEDMGDTARDPDLGSDAGDPMDAPDLREMDAGPDVVDEREETCRDDDGDGRRGSGICDLDDPDFDCDDDDPFTYPGADEVCDGRDNDCDGEPDDGVAHNACGGCAPLMGDPGDACRS